MRLGVFEPLASAAIAVAGDASRWWRFAGCADFAPLARAATFPVAVGASAIGRSVEMIGMYATMMAPEAMDAWAAVR